MAYPYPLAPPPVVDDPSMYGAIGMAPPPDMYTNPVGQDAGPPIGLAPPPNVMPAPVPPPQPPGPEMVRAPAPPIAEPPPELAPQPDAVSGSGMAPPPRSPDTIPAGPTGGKNAPSGPVDLEAQNIRQTGDLIAQQQEEASKGLIQAANERRDRVQMGRLMQVRDQQVEDAAFQDVQKSQEEARAMRVDPGHWWANRTTGQKVALLIGAMAGGFLQAKRGGSNDFLEGIQKAISTDIAAQESNMANARNSATAKQSLYGMMVQKFGNRETAYAATTAQMYDAAIDQVNAYASQFKSPLTQMEAQKSIIDLQKARDAAYVAAVHAHGKDMLDLVKAQDEHALAQANIAKSHAETAKIQGEAGGGPAQPVVVHGPKGSVTIPLRKNMTKQVDEEQKAYDEALKEQRAHAGKDSGSAEYQTYVNNVKDHEQRLTATLRAAGANEEQILAMGLGNFKPTDIATGDTRPVDPRDNQRRGVPMTPEQSAVFNEPQLAPPPNPLDSIPPLGKKPGKNGPEPYKVPGGQHEHTAEGRLPGMFDDKGVFSGHFATGQQDDIFAHPKKKTKK